MRRCSAWGTGFAAFVAWSVVGCGTGSRAFAPPPQPKADAAAAAPVTLAAPAAERSLVPQDRIAVLAATQVPASLQVDGQLTEWAAFADGKPTPLTPSFVVVAAKADSLVLMGRVRNLPAQGLWVRLASEAPEFPPIGSLQRGGGINPLQCDVPEELGGGAPFDSETCHRILAQYQDVQKSYAAMFVRQLHLTAQGVSIRTAEQEQPVPDAQYAFRAGAGADTFEAVLPLRALPRIGSAELAWLSVDPERADSGTPPEAVPEIVQMVAFARPIRFGMDSDLLGCLSQPTGAVLPTTPRFSYQPGVPNRVYRAANVGGMALEMNEVTLSSREGGLGPLEVRSLPGAPPLVAVFNQGQLLSCTSVGEVLGVVERGRGLHVIGYSEEYDDSVALEGAEFKVLEIEKDGTLHDDLLEASEVGYGYTAVGQAHAKNLSSFSISGTYPSGDGGGQQHTLAWRYDAHLNRYGLRERKGRYVPPPRAE